MRADELLPPLHEATRALIRTVDRLGDAELAGASVLPGWTRAHVVAHLALNAEALARVLAGVSASSRVPMYSSAEARDADIAALARATPPTLRDRFLASCTLFQEAAEQVPEEEWRGQFVRLPDGPAIPRSAVLPMRRREVEIHHADLDAGYCVDDWSEDFLDSVFNEVVHDRRSGTSMRLRTPDGDVLLGTGDGPVVTGSRADLTWWLLGRGGGSGLTADPALPTLAPWR
ncbi:MAG TPA: maleylpyruvate isomerase family mycothiol-dependent enzyme [Nocardioides sp.]|uniref:maleylpyruvate isomerase family mycothiol-dependent enzyme n=1 Tax=Nocardioides sp. TaxID=35761 RepID=UPI002B6FAE9A|nr:maleylpyruvate isomerase family mycothiol-dependent enzyme [Nocardioides sp.]HQR27113.1 maleylpyruvate isomerase family mycothiol-dependent enzyme [Nocardioides sp.]